MTGYRTGEEHATAKRIQATIPPEDFAEMCKMALRDRVPLAQQVRWAIHRWIEQGGRGR